MDERLPVVEPPSAASCAEDADAPRADATVAGLLLAAGESTRFGPRNKLLAAVDGEPVVRRVAETLLASDVDSVTAVVGHEAERIRTALSGLDVATVANPRYGAGQATSVRRGIEAIRADADAAAVALGDMPFVDPASVDALLAAYRAEVGDALAAAYRGRRGNPALFDAAYFDRLAAVEGDAGGRDILRREGTLVETGDPGVVRDVDRPADLDRGR